MALRPIVCTATVTEDDDVITVTGDDESTGLPVVLTDLNCRANAMVLLGGIAHMVRERLTTATFRLERGYLGSTDTDVPCTIGIFTPEMSSRVALSQQLRDYDARKALIDTGPVFFTMLGQTGANDPGPGNLARNAAAWADTTALYFDVLSAGGRDVSALIDRWDAGTVITLMSPATGSFVSFELSEPPSDEGPGAWRKLEGLTFLDEAGDVALEDVVVEWNRAGPPGTDGADGGPGADGHDGDDGDDGDDGVDGINGSSGDRVQILHNGSFAIAQRAMPTTDNAYCLDRWRLLLENANGATVSRDTADVPSGAGYACRLTVGSGNNGKFGIWQVIENKDMLALRGGVVSIRVPLKATAGLTNGTGKIRIGIAQFTGSADAVSGDPIASWGAEGTNPTLAANWAFCNVPAALAVGTSWGDELVENVAIGANATNIAVFIWNDDRTTTQTTDVLRVGGYVTLTATATAAPAQVLPFAEELRRCQRYFCKTFALDTPPAQNAGALSGDTVFTLGKAGAASNWTNSVVFPVPMRTAPTITTFNPAAASAQVYDYIAATSCSGTATGNISTRHFHVSCTGAAGSAVGNVAGIHWTADAEL